MGKKKRKKLNSRSLTPRVTDMPVMLSRPCLAASSWHFHWLFLLRLPSYLTVIRVINCSIKASLRIQSTLDAQPPGKRVVQLRWRTRLLLASDNQHATLIERQMGLFTPVSGLIEQRNQRLMMSNYDLYIWPNLPVTEGMVLLWLKVWALSSGVNQKVQIANWTFNPMWVFLFGLCFSCMLAWFFSFQCMHWSGWPTKSMDTVDMFWCRPPLVNEKHY